MEKNNKKKKVLRLMEQSLRASSSGRLKLHLHVPLPASSNTYFQFEYLFKVSEMPSSPSHRHQHPPARCDQVPAVIPLQSISLCKCICYTE